MKYEIFIPFPGFYESVLSQALDNEEEMTAENGAEDDGSVTAQQRGELIFRNIDYRKVHLKAAQCWVAAFNQWVTDESDSNDELGLSFKELISPREYNFETDRIMCEISEIVMYHLISTVTPMTLSKHAAERHTSRSGFHSFYSPDIRTWPEDVKEWDCNQLQTLLEAWVLDNIADADKWVDGVMEQMNDDWCNCIDAGMDWPKYEAAVAALK